MADPPKATGADALEGLAPEWQRAFRFIETDLGGRVVRAERQPRWRPAWFLDVELRNGACLPLYFRGERGETDHGVYALEHEMRVLRVLEDNRIPVPHVHAFCPDPRGIVMERCPGRANLATAESAREREAVLDDYMEILARIHAIDVSAFEAVGLARPATPEALALADFDAWERTYRSRKRRPEPAVELAISWVRRNIPRGRERVSFVCADSGQFLFENGEVTAVLDLELACLGDPAADLGGLRGRDLSEPLGDLTRAVAVYERYAGRRIDRTAIDYHTVRFTVMTPMAIAHLVAAPPQGIDEVQYHAWYLVWARSALEVVADQIGVSLEPPALPEVPASASSLADGQTGDFESYREDVAERRALVAARRERLGPALASDDLDDAARVLGQRPANALAADAALEALVQKTGGAVEAELISVLHRRLLREEAILGPALRELQGARMQRIG